jgi:hypothetical protein
MLEANTSVSIGSNREPTGDRRRVLSRAVCPLHADLLCNTAYGGEMFL